jgi:hypothetical protein
MGYYIHLTKEGEMVLLNCSNRSAKEALNTVWFLISLKDSSQQKLYYGQVSAEQCAQLIRMKSIDFGFILIENAGPPRTIVVTTKNKQFGIKLEILMTGGLDAAKRCTNCGVEMPVNHSFMGQSYTRAHNVIPSNAWKRIVARAIPELLAEIREPPELIDAYTELCAFMMSAGRKHTPEFETPDWFGRGVDNRSPRGLDIRRKLTEFDWLLMKELRMSGERASGSGATNYEGAQCGLCEKIHASLSLIQRTAVASAYPNSGMERSMVSSDYRVPPDNSGNPRNPAGIAQAHTERVAQRVLNEMLAKVDANYMTGWLAPTLLTYWSRWSTIVKRLAVDVCSEPIDPKAEADRIQGMATGGRKGE